MTHTILIRFAGRNDRGPVWDAWLLRDTVQLKLCDRSRDPEHDACRKLLELGYEGKAQTTDDTGKMRLLIPSIKRAAKYMVEDSAKRSPRIIPWKQHPMAEERKRRRELE